MPLRAIARLIQTMLYAQRFFPYYVYNILGGIEEDGKQTASRIRTRADGPPGSGAVYSFDPVGSYEREACRAAGAAQSLVQPFLDNQVCLLSAPRRRLASPARRHPILTRLTPVSADILQEPANRTRTDAATPSSAARRVVDRHRLVYECDGTPY